jgi:hypothetical protein
MNTQELADLIDTGIFPEGTLALATKMLRDQAKEIESLQDHFDRALDFLTRINTGGKQ